MRNTVAVEASLSGIGSTDPRLPGGGVPHWLLPSMRRDSTGMACTAPVVKAALRVERARRVNIERLVRAVATAPHQHHAVRQDVRVDTYVGERKYRSPLPPHIGGHQGKRKERGLRGSLVSCGG